MLIVHCHLTLHDTLYFATREMGPLYETERYVHNYALSYALFNDSLIKVPYFCASYRPQYEADLGVLNDRGIYVTPARPVHWDYILATWKMAQDRYRLFAVQFGAPHPVTGQRTTNFPMNIGRAKELAPGSEFEFFVISGEPVHLPRWIRLGKWHSKAEVVAETLGQPTEKKGPYTASAVLNPLDISGQLKTFDVISIPPVSLVSNALIDGNYYDLAGGLKIPAQMQYSFEKRSK
jgi:CRISPR-associated protein Csc1